jgi:hypothetical protein
MHPVRPVHPSTYPDSFPFASTDRGAKSGYGEIMIILVILLEVFMSLIAKNVISFVAVTADPAELGFRAIACHWPDRFTMRKSVSTFFHSHIRVGTCRVNKWRSGAENGEQQERADKAYAGSHRDVFSEL